MENESVYLHVFIFIKNTGKNTKDREEDESETSETLIFMILIFETHKCVTYSKY